MHLVLTFYTAFGHLGDGRARIHIPLISNTQLSDSPNSSLIACLLTVSRFLRQAQQ